MEERLHAGISIFVSAHNKLLQQRSPKCGFLKAVADLSRILLNKGRPTPNTSAEYETGIHKGGPIATGLL